MEINKKKNRKKLIIRYGILAVALIIVVFMVKSCRSGNTAPEMQTDVVKRGNITSMVSGNGVLKPYTSVEVKSNVGGQIVELAVDEGDYVKAGQLIAKIDPSDSVSSLNQSLADLRSAEAKVQQSKYNYDMLLRQTAANVQASEQALEADRQRLAQAEKQAQVQPTLTAEAVKQAQSNLDSAQASLKQIKSALSPQKIASAKSAYEQAKATYDNASSDVKRKRELLAKGFISKSDAEAAEQQYQVAAAQLESAKNKYDTVKSESDEDLMVAESKVKQAKAALETAKANKMQDSLKNQDLAVARASVKQSIANLESAKAGVYQNQMKVEDITQAKAQYEKVAAAVENARTQLGYTTVIAPSSGVVVKKYVEKGSIVTAGRSSFAGSGSGVTIVDIAEIDRMLIQVGVDETDIAQIKIGQNVDISVDAFPGQKFKGKVTKIAPEAVVDQSVTTVPVTVEIMQPDRKLKPEMNATCDFIVSNRENILYVPNEAVRETDRGSVVTVIENGKPVERSIKVGIVGTDDTEIISGLKEGETVVTSLIQPQMPGGTGQTQGTGRSGRGGMRGGPPPPF